MSISGRGGSDNCCYIMKGISMERGWHLKLYFSCTNLEAVRQMSSNIS